MTMDDLSQKLSDELLATNVIILPIWSVIGIILPPKKPPLLTAETVNGKDFKKCYQMVAICPPAHSLNKA